MIYIRYNWDKTYNIDHNLLNNFIVSMIRSFTRMILLILITYLAAAFTNLRNFEQNIGKKY